MGRFVEGQDRRQSWFLLSSLDDDVTADNPVRVVEAFIDELDRGALGFTRFEPSAMGRPAYDPATLLKLYLRIGRSGFTLGAVRSMCERGRGGPPKGRDVPPGRVRWACSSACPGDGEQGACFLVPGGDADMPVAIQIADQSMYEAKAAGPGVVRIPIPLALWAAPASVSPSMVVGAAQQKVTAAASSFRAAP